MREILILLVLMLSLTLTGCKEEKDCIDDYCINAEEYGMEGELTVLSVVDDVVTFSYTYDHEELIISSADIMFYRVDDDGVRIPDSTMGVDGELLNTGEVELRFLAPNSNYVGVLLSKSYDNLKSLEVVLDYVEFETGLFTPLEPECEITNLRIGSSYAIIDLLAKSNSQEIYWLELSITNDDGLVYSRYFHIGNNNMKEYEVFDFVVNDLNPNTEYIVIVRLAYFDDEYEVVYPYLTTTTEFTTTE